MKTKVLLLIGVVIVLVISAFQNNETWTDKQLMEPADLAKVLNDTKNVKPIVYAIGFAGGIKGSIEMGPAREKDNLDKLKAALTKLPKDADVVIYCGCCPFKNCPNVRPAFALLNEMKFTHPRLLNLSHNLKADWIDKGYRVDK